MQALFPLVVWVFLSMAPLGLFGLFSVLVTFLATLAHAGLVWYPFSSNLGNPLLIPIRAKISF